jgi:hypothetical protein
MDWSAATSAPCKGVSAQLVSGAGHLSNIAAIGGGSRSIELTMIGSALLPSVVTYTLRACLQLQLQRPIGTSVLLR